jgi:hypothetical protein
VIQVLSSVRARRLLGGVLVLAFLLALVLAASHVDEATTADHGGCELCLQLAGVGLPQLVAPLAVWTAAPATRARAPADDDLPCANVLSRAHSPRAPPVRS